MTSTDDLPKPYPDELRLLRERVEALERAQLPRVRELETQYEDLRKWYTALHAKYMAVIDENVTLRTRNEVLQRRNDALEREPIHLEIDDDDTDFFLETTPLEIDLV